MTDPAIDVVATVMDTLLDAYSADFAFPPEKPATAVRFFAGEAPPTAAWNAHTDETGCDQPFLWVRVMSRYRSKSFPEPAASGEPCVMPVVVKIEAGVARCAVVDENPSWEDYANEADLSLEDSWRIQTVLCMASKRLRRDNYTVATEEIVPYGPEGGILAWSGVIYVQLT